MHFYLYYHLSIITDQSIDRLITKVAVQYDLPLILHSRKAEKRVLELLLEEGVRRADFHCFCGKVMYILCRVMLSRAGIV